MEGWVEREIEGCEFPDERLKTRFGKLLGQLGQEDRCGAAHSMPGLGGHQGGLSVLRQPSRG